MNFAEGALWSEPGAGTNAIGTAIAADHAVQVFGPEHFNEPVQRWTCSAAPIHDPDTGELLGVIDLTGDFSTVHPHSLAVATATAQAVEAQRCGSSCRSSTPACAPATATASPAPDRARAGRPRPGRPITARAARLGRRRAGSRSRPAAARSSLPVRRARGRRAGRPALEAFVVRAVEARRARDARPLLKLALPRPRPRAAARSTAASTELRPRLAEILALLCAHPDGLTAEALCADLHGDGGSPASVRVEVCAPAQAARPVDRHRPLPADLRRRDRRPPRRGPARRRRASARRPRPTPARCCPAPRRPASCASASGWTRWLRQAVMTADDAEALWAWVQTPDRRRRPRRLEAPARPARVPRPAPRRCAAPRRRAARVQRRM